MDDVCYKYTMTPLREKDIKEEFGDQHILKEMARKFFTNEEEPRIIPVEELGEHDAAYFENNNQLLDFNYVSGEPIQKGPSTIDVLVNFKVDREKGTVTGKKLFQCMGKYTMQKRIYSLKDYGKTWRAWTGMPKEYYIF